MTIKQRDLPSPQKVVSQTINMGTIIFDPKKEFAKENKTTPSNGIEMLQKAIKDSAFKDHDSAE